MNNITKTITILLALLPVIFGQTVPADTNSPGEKPGGQPAPVIQLEPEFAPNVAMIKVDSATLLRAGTIHVAKNYLWQGLTFAAEPRTGDGSIPFKWKVAGLGLDGTGSLKNPKPAVVQWDWHLTNDKEWVADGTEVGNNPYGAIAFFLDLTSDARRGCTAKPVLKEDKTGFTWEMLPGQTVTVDFGPPLVKLYFETNKPSEIRCVMYMAPLEQGKFDRSMTITLPEGSSVVPTKAERYQADTKDWFVDALDPHASFIDLSDLNEKPAGKHGFVKTKGERLCFSDDTPVRFWGAAVAAYSLYVHNKDGTPDMELIDKHAKRLAELGFNLVRLTHVDSNWVNPNLIAKGDTTDKLNDAALDTLFYWVKALKEQGIYVWIDMETYRPYLAGDNIPGFDDLVAAYNSQRPLAEGFS